MTFVAWNAVTGAYEQKTLDRSNPMLASLLASLGRTIVTSITLQAGPNYRVRCQSYSDIKTDELFAAPGSAGRTFDSFLTATGRVEFIAMPYTSNGWLKVWSKSPTKPTTSREVTAPYNYPFSDGMTDQLQQGLGDIARGAGLLTPIWNQLQWRMIEIGLQASGIKDMWGWSKDLLLYIRPSTIRVAEIGLCFVTRRADVQKILNEVATQVAIQASVYAAVGQFPLNAPIEVRCCGLDKASEVSMAGAQSPRLSASKPRADRPDWDTAIWFNILGIPGTPNLARFYAGIEKWCRTKYPTSSTVAELRVEWSKGWAHTSAGAYRDTPVMTTTIPNSYRAGEPAGQGWDKAVADFNTLDPHKVFANSFLNSLLV